MVHSPNKQRKMSPNKVRSSLDGPQSQSQPTQESAQSPPQGEDVYSSELGGIKVILSEIRTIEDRLHQDMIDETVL